MTAPVPVPHFLLEKQMFDQDPCPDQDQDDPAQDAGVFLQQGTQLAAEIDRRKAEHEGRYPMIAMLDRMSTFRKAKVMPTANASMLVATARSRT